MSKFVKLPECLRAWKIDACISDEKGNALYKVSKKEYDGTVITAKLRYISIAKDEYTSENIDFINSEVSFLKSICQSGDYYNYIDIAVNNNPAKEKIELFLVTDELPTLAEVISNKTLDESEIVDFGIQMSEILEKLEANNIFHGNINLDNIYVTSEGKYKLGGFSDFESQIDDMSFIAPEIKRNENADFTTDIYSLGLILYYLCNNKKIPFMSDSTSKEDAINARFDGKAINAPANGSEKLKSVIVIACQPNNDNRWKNASNIKNALTSIKSELPAVVKADVIVPETTDFSGNVFDEYDYEEFEETATETPVSTTVTENTEISSETEEKAENTEDIEDAIEINTEIDSEEYIDSSENTDEIDNRVFDNYEVKGKVINFNQNTDDKDYGDYFDDDGVEEFTEVAQSISSKQNEEIINYDVDTFDDDFDTEITEDTENNNKNKLIVIICIIIMLAALGFVGFFIFNSAFSNNTKPTESTTASTTQQVETTISSTTATTQPSSTQPATTVPETTVAATTAPTGNTNVIPVVGYGYSYAKKLLEQAGFIVEIGEYEYSETYEEGYVIAQSPNGDTEAKTGSVVTLDISLGLIEKETTQPKTEPTKPTSNSSNNNQATDASYLFSNSDSAYLSQADVDALDRTNLNLALNEIYARRGRIFKDATLSAYFNSKTWYTPKYTSEEFSANVTFNKYEQANLQLMVNEQKSRGYR